MATLKFRIFRIKELFKTHLTLAVRVKESHHILYLIYDLVLCVVQMPYCDKAVNKAVVQHTALNPLDPIPTRVQHQLCEKVVR